MRAGGRTTRTNNMLQEKITTKYYREIAVNYKEEITKTYNFYYYFITIVIINTENISVDIIYKQEVNKFFIISSKFV